MKMNYLLRATLVAALLLSIPSQAQWVTAPISWETFAHTAVVQGDQLWIIGGTDPGTGGPINDIQVFDIPSTSMIESIQGQGAGG